MADFDSVIIGIQNKLRMLIGENTRLREELIQLRKRCDELQQAEKNDHILTNNLNLKTHTNQSGNTLATIGDPSDIKRKINQAIQAIDKYLGE